MIGGLLFFVFLGCLLLAFAFNQNAMSPAKYYLGTCAVFFGDVFINKDTSIAIALCYLGLLACGVVLVVVESRNVAPKPMKTARSAAQPQLKSLAKSNGWLVIWSLTLIPMLALYTLVQRFGAEVDLSDAIAQRVLLFQGYGYLTITLTLLPTLNAAYFVHCLVLGRRSRLIWLGWGLHVVITFGIQSLMGSRTGLLNVGLFLVLISHYIWRRHSAQFYAVFAIGLLAAASFLGTIRNTMRISDGRLDLNLDKAESVLNLSVIREGVSPLEVIFNTKSPRLEWGATFATALTNLIPRAWWPGKPDTGGVVYTKNYLENQWDGYSNATPGWLGEWMMNFGPVLGLILGFASLAGLLWWLGIWYAKLERQKVSAGNPLRHGLAVICFLYTVQAVTGLLIGEFTNCAVHWGAKLALVICIGKFWNVSVFHSPPRRRRYSWSWPGWRTENFGSATIPLER